MGYGIHINGLEAFESLLEGGQDLTGRPYCSYCFLLIQESDAQGVSSYQTFLQDGAQAMGSGLALLVFVDQARLDGEVRGHSPPPGRIGLSEMEKEARPYSIFENLNERRGRGERWQSEWTVSGERCVQMARLFNIPVSDFPCLVVVDHESVVSAQTQATGREVRLDHLVLPVGSNPADQLGFIRRLSDRFYECNRESQVLQAMSAIPQVQSEIDRLSFESATIERERRLMDEGDFVVSTVLSGADAARHESLQNFVESAQTIRSKFPSDDAGSRPVPLEAVYRDLCALLERAPGADPVIGKRLLSDDLPKKLENARRNQDEGYFRILSGHILTVASKRLNVMRREKLSEIRDDVELVLHENRESMSRLKAELWRLETIPRKQSCPRLEPVALELLKRELKDEEGQRRWQRGVSVSRSIVQSVVSGVVGGIAGGVAT